MAKHESRKRKAESRPVDCLAPRPALTLVELLVVIVILVTLVAGVIPLLSPNNDTRKIREASRGLQAYINSTQAEAARTGRPHGIGFRESPSGDGMALEVFRMEVPQAFAGFSEASRVLVETTSNTYSGNIARYSGFPLFKVNFGNATSGGVEPLPPGMFKPFDMVNVAGNKFLIVDSPNNIDPSNDKLFEYGVVPNTIKYFGEPNGDQNKQVSDLECVWVNASGQLPPQGVQSYRIIRQPLTSSASPFVLPAGIAIDMQGSMQEGDVTTFYASANTTPDAVNILFSPAGHVSSVLFNGNELTNVSRIILLLGRVENGNLQPVDYDFTGVVTNDQLEQQREKVNWLSLDSRWISIAARSGRAIVSDNAFVDPRTYTDINGNTDLDGDGNDIVLDPKDQIEAAHEIAHEMKRGGGR
ncbi:MAG: hypothetical protein ABGX16_20825 [Pirellulales bacterium]